MDTVRLENVMEKIDQIYAWKRLYWQAIESGFEPLEAGDYATRHLPSNLPMPRLEARNARISQAYRAVAIA